MILNGRITSYVEFEDLDLNEKFVARFSIVLKLLKFVYKNLKNQISNLNLTVHPNLCVHFFYLTCLSNY